MARIRGAGGQHLTQASLSSIAYAVRNLTEGTTDSTGTFTVSSTVFDNLQTGDPRWTKDAVGYNFLGTIDAGAFDDVAVADADAPVPYEVTPRRYRVAVRFRPTAGATADFVVPFEFSPIPVWLA